MLLRITPNVLCMKRGGIKPHNYQITNNLIE